MLYSGGMDKTNDISEVYLRLLEVKKGVRWEGGMCGHKSTA